VIRVHLQLENLAEFEETIQKALKPIIVAAEADQVQLANDIADRARNRLPDGAMKAALGVRKGEVKGQQVVEVGVFSIGGRTTGGADPARAAVPLEYGHGGPRGRADPHPFMRPAIAEAIAQQSHEVKE
jgi:hypothetical protein